MGDRWFRGVAALYVLLLYGGSGWAREVQLRLVEQLGGWYPLLPAILVLGGLAAVLVFAAARRRGGRVWLLVPVALCAYGGSLMYLEVPAERMHLLQYGLLAWLVTGSLSGRLTGLRLHVSSLVVVAALGAGDEAVQWLRPNRVGDLRDVGINAWSALLAQALLAGAGWPARVSDGRGAGRPIPPGAGT